MGEPSGALHLPFFGMSNLPRDDRIFCPGYSCLWLTGNEGKGNPGRVARGRVVGENHDLNVPGWLLVFQFAGKTLHR